MVSHDTRSNTFKKCFLFEHKKCHFQQIGQPFFGFSKILRQSKFSKSTNTNYRNDNRCSLYCVLLCWCKPRNNGKLIKISLLHHFSMVVAHYQFEASEFETFFVKTQTLPKIFYFLTDCYITVFFGNYNAICVWFIGNREKFRNLVFPCCWQKYG